MSLGNHTLSWPKWILCGRDFLSDEDSLELERRVGDWSADELIDAVTFLLERLKAAGTYEKYMEKTIGSLHSVNRCFENALCKIWRAGDIITTTNYDLQIEEAVGAEPISYSSPAEILSIIRGEGNKVIHLHGVYDKVRGMDNIIADGPQYKDILANAGAQFIQNLISTHTIVIVGCGGTVDDPNLSGFMNFVVKELGITNVPYFYLMKNGDSVPELPSNALPVYYGDDYSDLPDFLSELALVRLRERIGLRELAAFNPYAQTSTATTAFGRIHFSNGFNGFVGRDKELYELSSFLENPDRILWWSLVGDGGIGKSRLVMEWLKNSPTHWFGFFARKTPEEEGDFKPFTDTVIVFDYVLGQEKECAETIGAFLEAFKASPYKLRIMLLDRAQQDNGWFRSIARWMDAENRLTFEKAFFKASLHLTELSEDDETRYIENYLTVYLPLVETNAFVEECRADIRKVGETIAKAFRSSVEPACYRPLYLSIFIEVWIEKEGRLSLSSADELMDEYLNREINRWKTILKDADSVDSYLRLLAMACAVEIFNISDVYGDNYLKTDCEALTAFFDKESSKPGANNTFEDFFVSMTELESVDEGTTVFDMAFGVESEEQSEKAEGKNPFLSMDDDDRMAFIAPYIKLDADPTEVYLTMLEGAGAAEDEELEQLKRVKEEIIKKAASLPDHAWIIEPILPTVVKEFIVRYVVNERDIVRFTKLARSNSVYGFANFLIHALEDKPCEGKFQRMVVTPPNEELNFFEYYVSLLVRIESVEDFRPVEKVLIKAVPLFNRYQIELWMRISCVLADRADVERLYDSACGFVEYLESLDGLVRIKDEAADVIRNYAVGIHNAKEREKYEDYIHRLDCIEDLVPDSAVFGEVFSENYRMLINLKLYENPDADVKPEWERIREILNSFERSDIMIKTASDAAYDYLHSLNKKDKPEELEELESSLEEIYRRNKCVEIAKVAALVTANVFVNYFAAYDKILAEKFEKVKAYLSEYPDNQEVCSAYISVSRYYYLDSSIYKKVPYRVITQAKELSQKYPDEIEFQEGYFGLLLAKLEYAQAHESRSQQTRIFDEMKLVALRTDYSAYNEENEMLETIEMYKTYFGYR